MKKLWPLRIDAAFFARMKRGAVFINIGRGSTVDEAALAALGMRMDRTGDEFLTGARFAVDQDRHLDPVLRGEGRDGLDLVVVAIHDREPGPLVAGVAAVRLGERVRDRRTVSGHEDGIVVEEHDDLAGDVPPPVLFFSAALAIVPLTVSTGEAGK